jgi:Magnesium chelatase, subunit ChlI
VAGLTNDRTALVTTRPFRAPHHTISDAGLIGGEHVPMSGEVSLAHHGILFLDELPEFRRHVQEVVRPQIEKSITRIQSSARPGAQDSCRVSRMADSRARLGQRTMAAYHHRSDRHARGITGISENLLHGFERFHVQTNLVVRAPRVAAQPMASSDRKTRDGGMVRPGPGRS